MNRSRALALVVLAIAGCAQDSGSLIESSGTQIIRDTSAVYFASSERISLLIWHDFMRELGSSSGGHGSSGYTSSSEATEIKGDYWIANDKVFEFSCHTSDGITGSVDIGGSEYDLARGCVFLVQADHGGYTVTQLDRQLKRVGPIREMLESLASTDPQIMNFIQSGERSEE
jgi:hypothetical protein